MRRFETIKVVKGAKIVFCAGGSFNTDDPDEHYKPSG